MIGYIGVRAKRKKRNIIIFLIFIIISFIFFYTMPVFKLIEKMPIDTLLPSEEESTSLDMLTIEELQSKLFDRDQKIIFRNSEVKKIREELKILLKENEQLSVLILNLKNQRNLVSSNIDDSKNNNIQLEKIKKDNKKELQKLNDIVLEITNKKNSLFKDIQKINSENELLKKEYKIIIKKNMQLTLTKDSLERKLNEQTSVIKEQTSVTAEQTSVIDELNILIQTLRDNYHHR